ncbi:MULTISPECIES: DUF2799 domain-containing protein [Dickeya]|uniref:DUF2799 domain-containing protein n=1 Tax=Dickeya aquatica TaxID=1401087 RepID=A0A375A7X2_9GAMM|nr:MULTISPECIES: DUF2799 domain-containing protein [Dickeya]SLM62016.1 hypothetical protein DAQ1742_00969 [Dickeya aquatica]
MTKVMVLTALILSLTGCQTAPDITCNNDGNRFWYEAGYNDATSGAIVKDNETLSEWSGRPEIDRHAYLAGYRAGQMELCHTDTLANWGSSGKPFPSGCDSVQDTEKLRKIWQSAIDQTHISAKS